MGTEDIRSIKVSHSIPSVIAGITLAISLIGSWSWFYSEQRLNSQKINTQEAQIQEHKHRIQYLEKTQNKIVIVTNNNAESIRNMTESLKDVIDAVNKNQLYLIKIVNRNKLD